VKGWAELKEAFWAAVDSDPAERARQIAALESIDPALSARLEALLAADDRGESLEHLFQAEPVSTAPPARIGPYEVVGVLGVGGMGEVYRARDARLQREVAIKVLPAAVTTDPERLARFEREAQVLASLNHPNIAQVYGLDDSGGVLALVMELVSGPTLADVIAGHPDTPLALSRALGIARQIAEGLDAAHEKAIVHRDLKPRNVALTQEGDVKILDFGVAKSLSADTPKAGAVPGATEAGVLLGTPAYMSPEQARGLTVDKRTDIWAFGCLLYELLTGRQAFQGDTASDSLAAVLEREPDMAILPAGTPSGVRSLVRHCLEKDPKRRLRDIADARLALVDALNQSSDGRSGLQAAALSKGVFARVRGVWLLAGLAIAASAVIIASGFLRRASSTDPPRRTITSVVLPRGMRLGGADLQSQASQSRFAISPDGRQLALVASDESGRVRLWLRDLGSARVQPLPQTDDASFPFWSPDSDAIGFVAAGKLKAIRLSDAAPITVNGVGFQMGAWNRDDRILLAPAPSSPLFVVPASGGALAPVTSLDSASGEVQHGRPAFLPDGRRFLYFSIGSRTGGMLDPRGIHLGTLDASEPPRLLLPDATEARYSSGHIVYMQSGRLMAQPFDLESRTLRGNPRSLVEDVKLDTISATGMTAAFSVSDDVLALQAAVRVESRPVVLDRKGKQLEALAPPADYGEVALSPDGRRLAVSVSDPGRSTRDLWLYELDGGRGQRLTFDAGDEFAPVWSPDGRRLLFSAMVKSGVDLRIKDVMAAGDPRPLEVDNLGLGRFAADWSADGRHIMYVGGGRAITRSDLWVAPVASPREARALLDSNFVETQGRFAPGGRWFAYASNETGRLEVYVDRFPERGAKRLVSTQGGRWPRWRRDGTELFYLSPDGQLMAVAMKPAMDRLDIGPPRALFEIRARPPVRLDAYSYDVTPDGQRFVVNTLMEDAVSNSITVVLNWTAGLPKR
jgi:eukaryotic-like serine/threonine-protein kinase